MMEAHHKPVMVKEVLDALQVRPKAAYIDCTVGEGGHALTVLGATEPEPRLLGVDLDSAALKAAARRLRAHGERAVLVQGNFADLHRLAVDHGFSPADGILFDLGVSSLQLETPERGFSFTRSGPLDMRFDINQEQTALEVVNERSEQELADLLRRFGEEWRARRIARAIALARPIKTTGELAQVIATAGRRGSRGQHPATRSFLALRILVNEELENLRAGLGQAIRTLVSGGRMAVISYHSLEDRLAKAILGQEASSCICPPGIPVCVCEHKPSVRLVNRKIIRPSPEEVRENPRSRSARMRVAERL